MSINNKIEYELFFSEMLIKCSGHLQRPNTCFFKIKDNLMKCCNSLRICTFFAAFTYNIRHIFSHIYFLFYAVWYIKILTSVDTKLSIILYHKSIIVLFKSTKLVQMTNKSILINGWSAIFYYKK